jgi:hypothetical protein
MYWNGGFHGNECLDIVWDLWWTEWQGDSLFSGTSVFLSVPFMSFQWNMMLSFFEGLEV